MHFFFISPVRTRPARYSYHTVSPRTATTPAQSAYLSQLLPLLVVLQEEPEVLVRDVDVRVPAQPSVLLLRLLPAREPVPVDLVLDLVRRVRHVDARVLVRRAHLRLRALQRREELGVDQRRLGVLELHRDVPRQPEVRVLVDGARDQARQVAARAEDVRERVRERRRGLNRGEVNLADVVAVARSDAAHG